MHTFLFLLCIILALLCSTYGIAVRAIGSGTAFFAVWLVLAVFFVCVAIGIHFHLWKMFPDILKKGIGIVLTLCLASFLIIEGLVISQMHVEGPDDLDYLIVLGAQVYKNGPSPVLKFRLDKAYEYLTANPDTRCIVTGGQGSNEPFTEASCMADYLVKRGIDSGRIILEDKSTTTAQNLTNSMKLISADTINKSSNNTTINVSGTADADTASNNTADSANTTATNTIGILTNDFHMFRAMQIARAQNIPNAYGISCSSTKVYLPNNMFREYFAEIKFLLKQLIHF